MKFSLIAVRLMLSLVTVEVGQKYCSITSVSHCKATLRSECVCVKERFIFKAKNVRNAARRFIFYASMGQRKYAAYTNLVEHILQPTGRFKTYDSTRWILLNLLRHSFWFYHPQTHTHISVH